MTDIFFHCVCKALYSARLRRTPPTMKSPRGSHPPKRLMTWLINGLWLGERRKTSIIPNLSASVSHRTIKRMWILLHHLGNDGINSRDINHYFGPVSWLDDWINHPHFPSSFVFIAEQLIPRQWRRQRYYWIRNQVLEFMGSPFANVKLGYHST